MRAEWIDADAAPEGTFSVDLQRRVWTLRADQIVRVPVFRAKRGIQWEERWVPSLTGTVRFAWDIPLGNGVRHMFAGLIDLPGFSTARPVEVQGGFDESTGSVTINLFGNVFTIAGTLTGGDVESSEIDQRANARISQPPFQPAGESTGDQPIAILPSGQIINQGAK